MNQISIDSREQALSKFRSAFSSGDVDAIYRAVTPDFVWRLPIGPDARVAREIDSPQALAEYLSERTRIYSELRYSDSATYHSDDATFVTFRVAGKRRADDASFDVLAMERYLFRDGRVSEKDAYWKNIRVE